MAFGLPVHAALIYDNIFSNVAGAASMHFRMASFFLISGFFTSMVAARSSTCGLILRRARILLIPFLTMVFLVQPVTFYLVHLNHKTYISFLEFTITKYEFSKLPAHMAHLWFLPVLFIFVLLTPAMRGVLRLAPLARLTDTLATWRGDILIVAFALASGVAAPLLHKAAGVAPLLLNGKLDWTASEMMRYLPFFAVGVALNMNRSLLDRFHKISLPALVIGAVFALGWADPLMTAARISPTGAEEISRAVLTAAIVPALLCVFKSLFTRHNRTVSALTNAIYSVYLFHYPTLFAMALLLKPWLGDGVAAFFANIALTFVAAFLLHHLVIARVPLLRLMFNGRPLREPRGGAAAPAVAPIARDAG